MSDDIAKLADSRTLSVHRLFRGAAEFTKYIRRSALLCEGVAITIAASNVYTGASLLRGWASLIILFLILLSAGFRIWSRSTQAYSERCRRVSARAFAKNEQVKPCVCSDLDADAPIFTKKISSKLSTQTLDDYYEPTKAAGMPRLREIYAHSSFYTWRLLKRAGISFILIGGILISLGVIIVYGLVVNPPAATTAGRVLYIVCLLVFANLSVKAIDAGITALIAAFNSRKVATGLLGTTNAERIAELTLLYDMVRNSGPQVPTLIYSLSRDELQEKWHIRRTSLDEII